MFFLVSFGILLSIEAHLFLRQVLKDLLCSFMVHEMPVNYPMNWMTILSLVMTPCRHE